MSRAKGQEDDQISGTELQQRPAATEEPFHENLAKSLRVLLVKTGIFFVSQNYNQHGETG